MSSNPPSTSLLVNNNIHKKPKRKRRKNKNKKYYSITKRKYQKKFYRRNSALPGCYFSSKKFHCNDPIELPHCREIMSNWYWSNYKKAVEWQDKHKIAHWKACALALQEENRYLMQVINSIQPGRCPELTVTCQDLCKKINNNKPTKSKPSKELKTKNVRKSDSIEEEEEEENNEFEFEMSEEMIQFFEQSLKHKMDLEKMKEEKKSENDMESQVKQIQLNRVKRAEEMQVLYGDGASMITGMETAVQLSFDKYCDTKSPKYWPNIPLKLTDLVNENT